jgi:hypothetical protein
MRETEEFQLNCFGPKKQQLGELGCRNPIFSIFPRL